MTRAEDWHDKCASDNATPRDRLGRHAALESLSVRFFPNSAAAPKWLGYQTVKGVSESKTKGIFSKKTPSESTSDQRRALLLPQEITSLGKEAELVIVEDCPPIRAKKIRYYKDPVFVDRLKSVSPTLAALGKKLPTEKQLKDIVMAGELASPVPMIDLAAHHAATNAGNRAPVTVAVPKPAGAKTETIERLATPDDVSQLAKMTLANFAVDFSAVEQPTVGELDEAALHAYADNLCRQAGINV